MTKWPADLIEIHRGLNASTRDAGARYALHRARVASLLGTGRRLAVLGAGNCNDLDLDALARDFDALELLDIDVAAVRAALDAHPRAAASARAHEVDLSGALALLPEWARASPSSDALRRLPVAASCAVSAAVGGRCDVVLSSLVLSQLVHTAMEALGRAHPALAAVAIAIVVSHLRIALDLLEPGGRLVLAVDTFARPRAELENALRTHGGPAQLLLHMDAAGLCLPGTSVSFLVHALGSLAPAATVSLEEPWTWAPSEHRHHLVHALVIRT